MDCSWQMTFYSSFDHCTSVDKVPDEFEFSEALGHFFKARLLKVS